MADDPPGNGILQLSGGSDNNGRRLAGRQGVLFRMRITGVWPDSLRLFVYYHRSKK